MTADISPQKKQSGPTSLLPTLTLVLAAMTVCFALLSIILGNRLATLQAKRLEAQNKAVASESISMEQMANALKTATVDLETAQQALNAEKSAADRYRKQLSAVTKDLDTAKANLTNANRTITELKSMLPAKPAPAGVSPDPLEPPALSPPPQPEPKATGLPVSVPVQPKTPVGNEPDASVMPAPEPEAGKAQQAVSPAVPPAAVPPASPVTEETITDSLPASPAASPATD